MVLLSFFSRSSYLVSIVASIRNFIVGLLSKIIRQKICILIFMDLIIKGELLEIIFRKNEKREIVDIKCNYDKST